MNGHLAVLQWLRDPARVGGPCPWGVRTCHWAALRGHYNLLHWAHFVAVPPCPWDFVSAAYYYGLRNEPSGNWTGAGGPDGRGGDGGGDSDYDDGDDVYNMDTGASYAHRRW